MPVLAIAITIHCRFQTTERVWAIPIADDLSLGLAQQEAALQANSDGKGRGVSFYFTVISSMVGQHLFRLALVVASDSVFSLRCCRVAIRRRRRHLCRQGATDRSGAFQRCGPFSLDTSPTTTNPPLCCHLLSHF
jgi:hypothetical protein